MSGHLNFTAFRLAANHKLADEQTEATLTFLKRFDVEDEQKHVLYRFTGSNLRLFCMRQYPIRQQWKTRSCCCDAAALRFPDP